MFNICVAQIRMYMLMQMRFTIPQETNTTQITILQSLFNKSNQMLAFDERGKPEDLEETSWSRVENQQTQTKHDV